MWQQAESTTPHANKSASHLCNPKKTFHWSEPTAGLLNECEGCSAAPWTSHQMLHSLRQLSRQPHRSLDPWCCPRWGVSGSSNLQSPTPGHYHWRGWSQVSGSSPGGSGCCLALWADRGCWWWSLRYNPEGCWPDQGQHQEPTLWGSYHKRLLSWSRSSTPAPAPALQFSNIS